LAQASGLSEPRSVRHRRAMIDLVIEGGWIDERRFGMMVMGNRFRDLNGLLSLVPLGIRMLAKGKFPTTFEPSQNTQVVGALIQTIKLRTSSPKGSAFMTPLPQASNPSNTNNPQKLSLSQPEPKLGWTAYAEQINGRFAMLGLVIVLLLEVFTHQSLLAWLGL
jgi:hypothetical protein